MQKQTRAKFFVQKGQCGRKRALNGRKLANVKKELARKDTRAKDAAQRIEARQAAAEASNHGDKSAQAHLKASVAAAQEQVARHVKNNNNLDVDIAILANFHTSAPCSPLASSQHRLPVVSSFLPHLLSQLTRGSFIQGTTAISSSDAASVNSSISSSSSSDNVISSLEEEAVPDPFLLQTASGWMRKPSNKAASQQRQAFKAKQAQKWAEKSWVEKAAKQAKKVTTKEVEQEEKVAKIKKRAMERKVKGKAKAAKKVERMAQKSKKEVEKEEQREAKRLRQRANQSNTLLCLPEFAMASMPAEVSSED